MYKFDAKKVKDEIIQWIRDYFKDIPYTNIILGISGGKDSTVAAALYCEALGASRVKGLLIPDGEQKDIGIAKDVVSYLGIDAVEVNIKDITSFILNKVSHSGLKVTNQTANNIPPRVRMTVLFAFAQSMNARVSCNANLSEIYIGWYTMGGDNVGSIAPLANLTCTEVIEIGKELGLPDKFINKTPSDGLCGKSDEESFGFSYEVLDRYIRTGEIDDLDIKKKIDKMHDKNLFKLSPIESFWEGEDVYTKED